MSKGVVSIRWYIFTSLYQSIVIGKLFFDIVLITASVLGAFVSYKSNEDQSTSFWIFISAMVVLVIKLIVTILTHRVRRYQDPEKYGTFTIEGRSFSNAFKFIAYCIWLECNWLEDYSKLFQKFKNLVGTDGDPTKTDLSKSDLDMIMKFNRKATIRFYRIRRIHFMMVALGKGMKVPAHRLSDFLFQFSPDIFSRELHSTIEVMVELISILDVKEEEGEMVSIRRKELATKISRFFESVQKRKDYQETLIKSNSLRHCVTDLHDQLIYMSGGFGISNSFYSYCKGLQDISRAWQKARTFEKEEYLKMLRFWFHKRSMFPGFDLHALLLNFSRHQNSIGHQIEHTKILNAAYLLSTKKNEELISEGHNIAGPLTDIAELVSAFLFTQRRTIRQNFLVSLRSLIKLSEHQEKKKIIFITHGFSSVVNGTLYWFANHFLNYVIDDESTKVKDEFQNHEIIFNILPSPFQLESEHLTTLRYLRHKFKENPNIPVESDHKITVRIGNMSSLIDSHDFKKNCIGIVLSGAEFVQKDSRKRAQKERIRFINTEGWGEGKKVKRLEKMNLHHWILVEEHKIFPNSFSPGPDMPEPIGNYFNAAFYQDQLEHSRLYDWKYKRELITGRETL